MELLTLLNIICACIPCIFFYTVNSKKLKSFKFWAFSTIHSISCYLQSAFVYFLALVVSLPTFWIPIFIYRFFVILIARMTQPNFGNILSAYDSVFVEDCFFKKGLLPTASLVNSITIEAPIGIEELRSLFNVNVIRRAHMNGIRYPELRQFPVKFMGYVFWKNDDKFKLDDHVIEQDYKEENLSLLHQEMLNKPFTPYKSPWEVVLINGGKKTFIFGRFHHCIIDAKSILKLFVECLGNQELTMAQAQKIPFGGVDKLLMPFRFIPIITNELLQVISFRNHPWKVDRTKRDENYGLPQLVRFSPKLSLSDIKEVGKKSGGTASSVIMAIISGSISKLSSNLGDMSCVYVLPKEGHPPTLGNHADCAFAILPTSESKTTRRLETCHKIFKKLKTSNIGRYIRVNVYMIGTLFDPLRKVIFPELSISHLGISNIAGESKGFSIGGRSCSEFAFSVGTFSGDSGVGFCASSYKGYLQIAIISKCGILTENELEKLALGMSEELEDLKRVT